MTTTPVTICVVVGTLLLSGLASAQDHEKKVKRSDLPAAVEKAVARRSLQSVNGKPAEHVPNVCVQPTATRLTGLKRTGQVSLLTAGVVWGGFCHRL
jgi:hypothetical protein